MRDGFASLRKRTLGLLVVINTLLCLAVALPIAAILSHITRWDVYVVWLCISLGHVCVTFLFFPRLMVWLQRKDRESELRRRKD